MSDTTISDEERQIVHLLAFAGREFDRVRDLLIDDDEPNLAEDAEDSEGSENTESDSDTDTDSGGNASSEKRGLLRRAVGVAGTVARGAGRIVTGSVHPRHPDWQSADLDDRIDWWVTRFGTAAATLAAVPGIFGKVGRIVGVGDVVGASAQILVVHAVAREMDVTDLDRRVVAAAKLALGHDLDQGAVAQMLDDPEAHTEGQPAGDEPEEQRGLLGRVGRSATLLWRVANRMRRLRSDLGNRQRGGLIARAVSNLPAVGAAGAFLAERTGIRRAADEAREDFAA